MYSIKMLAESGGITASIIFPSDVREGTFESSSTAESLAWNMP